MLRPLRSHGSRAFLAGFVAALVFQTANEREAWAEPADEPIVLAYRAPPGCPSREQFFESVRHRARAAREARAGEPARRFEITLEERGTRFAGSVAIQGEGEVTSRELVAPSCAELVRALALVVGLALDPRPMTKDEEVTRSADPAPARKEPAPMPERPASTPAPGEPESRARPLHTELRAFLGGARLGGLAIEPLWSVHAGAEIEGVGRPVFAPMLRLALELAPTRRFERAAGFVHFRYLGAALSACPLALRAAPVGLRPCVTGNVGVLHTRSSGVPNPAEATRPWVDLGPEARVFAEAGPVRLESGVSWSFPVIRDRYRVADQTVHSVPGSSLRFVLDLCVQIL